jgi:hypothetical protein
MQLPLNSYDTNFHIFFASHYVNHWFDPWNPKWYAGFAQTTYPPLTHQWIAVLSHVMGLQLGYMLVQFAAILLLVVGVYRFARLWVDERAAGYAAVAAVFVGAESFLVYQAGQLSTTTATPLFLNALPYFYWWVRKSRMGDLLKGLALMGVGAAAHHATLLFAAALFTLPVLILAIRDSRRDDDVAMASAISRAVAFGILTAIIIAVVLLPFWIALFKYPVTQTPIPHASRSNYILNPIWGVNYWVVPYGAMILALPFIVIKGAVVPRLRWLLIAFWVTFLLGLGGTTPVARVLLGRSFYVITMERFSYWASLMALPIIGLLVVEAVDRWGRKALVACSVAAGATFAFSIGWLTFHPINYDMNLKVDQVANYLNRDGHDRYRYITLGFSNRISALSVLTDAGTVDGEWNSGRHLPELTQHGGAALTNAKYFGEDGMAALSAILQHADRYGLKWVFLRDPYYKPLLVFAGWRKVDELNNNEISVWENDGVPPATPLESPFMPPRWHGLLWGTLPFGSSVVALMLVIGLPAPRRLKRLSPVPSPLTHGVPAIHAEEVK